MQMLVIRIASYPDRLGPSGKFVENSTKLTCLQITGYLIKCSAVVWLIELQIRRGRKVLTQVHTVNSNSRSSNCHCSLFSKKPPVIRNSCVSELLAVAVNPDKWSSTVFLRITKNRFLKHHHHHHHHMSVMELGHLLTRSGLTYPEVSSEVCHDSFCQLGNSVSLSWAVCREASCLHVVSSSSCIPAVYLEPVLFLIPLQCVNLFCNCPKCILLFFSYISSLLLLFSWHPLL